MGNRVPILMYHSISQQATPRFKRFVVTPATFTAHIAYLHEQGCTPITVTQWTQWIANVDVPLPPRPVILTFDDGFADFYTAGLPVLHQHNFTATLYVTTAYMGGTSTWLWREGEAHRPVLDWGQLAEICASGVECGAHSHTHPHLDMVPPATAVDEIVRSKQLLEEHLKQPILSFAYPYGHYSRRVRQQVQAAGYTSACAVNYTFSSMTDDCFALSRLIVTEETTIHALSRFLTGRGPNTANTWSWGQAKVGGMARRLTALLKRNV